MKILRIANENYSEYFLYEPELIGKLPKVFDHIFKSFNHFLLSEVHFITSKVDSREVVDSNPNDNVIHTYPKEATVGYTSKNISYYFM